MRFYYNPILSKLMPIGFDGMAGNDDLIVKNMAIETNVLGLFEDINFHRNYRVIC